MKIVSINYLAAVGALALLTPSTDAQKNLRPSHAQQRLRGLTDEEVISAAVSMSMANVDGGGWSDWGDWSKSSKSKSSKSEWEGVGEWSKSAKSKSAKSEWEGVMAPTATEQIQAVIESIVSGESPMSTEDAVDVVIAEMSSLCYDGYIEAPSPEVDLIVTPSTSIVEQIIDVMSSTFGINKDEVQAALSSIDIPLEPTIADISDGSTLTEDELAALQSWTEDPQAVPPAIAEIAEIAEASTPTENELGALQSWVPGVDEVAAEVSSISPDGIDMMQSPSMTAGDLELLVGELSSVFGISEEEVQAALSNVMSLTAGMSSQEVDLDSAIDQMSSMSGISKAEAEAAVEGIMSQVPTTQEAAALVEGAGMGVDPAIAQVAQGEVEAVLAPIEAEIPKITTEEAAALYGSVNSNSQEVGAMMSSLSVEKVIQDLVNALQAGQLDVAQALASLELQLPSMASQLEAQGIVLSEYAPEHVAVVFEDP